MVGCEEAMGGYDACNFFRIEYVDKMGQQLL